MSSPTEFQSLLEQIARDGMVVRKVIAKAEDVVYLKSLLEAYPGLFAVHAERRHGPHGPDGRERHNRLVVATSVQLAPELDGLLGDLHDELGLVIEGTGLAS